MGVASIRANAISRAFTTGTVRQQVLKDLSIEIHPGEMTLIVGPSGSGKSTLVSILSGLLRPDEGSVDALGTRLWDLGPEALDAFRLKHFGFVFQGFNLFSALTALEQVQIPLSYTGISETEARKRAFLALEEVDLGPRMHLRPAELSGGEKQRVAIARALAKEPDLLFADEPTSSLDGKNGQIVAELLHRIARRHGATVVGVTHDPRLLKHADRVVGLEDGQINLDERRTTQSAKEDAPCPSLKPVRELPGGAFL